MNNVCEIEVNLEQINILKHAAKTDFYCGGSPEMNDLCAKKLMKYAGKKSFVPNSYYKITFLGRELIS